LFYSFTRAMFLLPIDHARYSSFLVQRFVAVHKPRQSPPSYEYSPRTASPYVHSPRLRPSWLLGSCSAHDFSTSLFFHGFGLRTGHRLLGRCLHQQRRVDSFAFATFPANLVTTIPTSDFSPLIALT